MNPSSLLHSVLAIFLLVSSTPVRSDLLIEPKDITLLVDQQARFTLLSNSEVADDVTIRFSLSLENIIRTEPDEVIIPGNASKSFSQTIKVFGLSPGHVDLLLNATPSIVNLNAAYTRVNVERSEEVSITSIIVGWIYFVVWSISFYPQVYENWKRKSVVGLNFDFLALNLTGFTLYSLFNCGLYWIPLIQKQYFERHPTSAIPVQPNDIFFSLHAVAITLITILQCFMYERGGQTVSIVARCIQALFFVFLTVSMLCSAFGVLLWLDFLYFCSYVKLAITLIKYIPQGYMNYRRKSTVGWSIGNIFCDLTGGVLSVLQMVLDAYNFNDWESIFTSPTKFGLGMFSILFDVFFMVQHYILYRNLQNPHGYETLAGHDSSEAPGQISDEDADPQTVTLTREAAPREFVT